MKGLEQVRSIHFMMSGNERVALRNYLQCFESRKKGHKPQSVILLDLIEKYDDDEKVLLLLKKKVAKEDARRMIIGRLRDKMLSSLVLDVNLERDDIYDDQARARAKVSKGKLEGQILIARGQRSVGLYVLNRAIQLAKQFEQYDDLVEMLGVKRATIKIWDKNYDEYDKAGIEMENYAACRDAVYLAKRYYREVEEKYGLGEVSNIGPEQEHIRFLKTKMDELNKAFEETSSATVGYYAYYLLVEYHQIQNNLKEADDHLNNLAQMIENNPSIRRRVRLSTIYANIGVNKLRMYNYKEGAVSLKKSLTYLRKTSRNYAYMSEYLFYTQFYSGSLKDAGSSMELLLDNKEQGELRTAVRNYLLACVAFAKGELKKVPHYLMDSHAMDKDKEGWNIGARVLSILHAIEKENFDYADSLIVNLRQFTRDGLKGVEVRSRDKFILEVLLELRKTSYSFDEVQETKTSILKQLAQDNIDTGWMLQTPEMICFHTWFNDKLNDRPYQPNYTPNHIYKER